MSGAKVIRDLRHLTGAAARGRLAGSEGAHRVSSYLATAMEEAGAEPLDGSWFLPVEVRQRVTDGSTVLQFDTEPVAHRLQYAERPDLGGGGSGSGRLLDPHDASADVAGAVIAADPRRVDIGLLARTAAAAGASAILMRDDRTRFPRKIVYGGGEGVPVFALASLEYERLAARQGAHVRFHVVLTDRVVTCRNVIGSFGDSSSDRVVVMTAHFDHVGDDPDGFRFPGAFDNAGGVAAVLQAVRNFSSRLETTRVVVAFLTGEESGLWGARALLPVVERLSPAAIINVDGIGSERLAAMRTGGLPTPTRALAEQVLRRHRVEARRIDGRDDSLVFRRAGLPVVGLGQEPVSRRLSFLHTPADNLGGLTISAVEQCAAILGDVVERVAVVKKGMSHEGKTENHVGRSSAEVGRYAEGRL